MSLCVCLDMSVSYSSRSLYDLTQHSTRIHIYTQHAHMQPPQSALVAVTKFNHNYRNHTHTRTHARAQHTIEARLDLVQQLKDDIHLRAALQVCRCLHVCVYMDGTGWAGSHTNQTYRHTHTSSPPLYQHTHTCLQSTRMHTIFLLAHSHKRVNTPITKQDSALRGVHDLDTLALRLQRKRAGTFLCIYIHTCLPVHLVCLSSCRPVRRFRTYHTLLFRITQVSHRHHNNRCTRAAGHVQGVSLRPKAPALHRSVPLLLGCCCLALYWFCIPHLALVVWGGMAPSKRVFALSHQHKKHTTGALDSSSSSSSTSNQDNSDHDADHVGRRFRANFARLRQMFAKYCELVVRVCNIHTNKHAPTYINRQKDIHTDIQSLTYTSLSHTHTYPLLHHINRSA